MKDFKMICGIHNVEMTLKPAGISKKSGKPYGAFWSCPERTEDGGYCTWKPGNMTAPAPIQAAPREENKRDFVAEGHVKGLNNLAGHMLSSGKTPTEVLAALPTLVEIVDKIDELASPVVKIHSEDIPF